MALQQMQIGEVAQQTSLSLRTIRYYEEMGLVVPSDRTSGGFRLYTDADVTRLLVIRRMKPLGFSLDEMRSLLATLDALAESADDHRGELLEQLETFHEGAQAKVAAVREQLATAEEFAAELGTEIAKRRGKHTNKS